MLDLRREEPRRREYARIARDHDLADLELAGERGRMNGAGSAEGDQREPSRVEALTDRDEPDALDHLRVDDAVNAERRLLEREPASGPAILLAIASSALPGSSFTRPPATLEIDTSTSRKCRLMISHVRGLRPTCTLPYGGHPWSLGVSYCGTWRSIGSELEA
jgi:hypothetical protein